MTAPSCNAAIGASSPHPASDRGAGLSASGDDTDSAQSVLSMALAGTVFALETSVVLEVLDVVPLSPVPNSKPFIKGLLNVRGKVVPVVDLKVRLGLTRQDALTLDSRIVVLAVPLDGEETLIGIMADTVFGVANLDTTQLADAPSVGIGWRAEFIKSIGRRNDGFIVVLDVEKVFEGDGAGGEAKS